MSPGSWSCPRPNSNAGGNLCGCGGLDYKINRPIAARFQADYIQTHFFWNESKQCWVVDRHCAEVLAPVSDGERCRKKYQHFISYFFSTGIQYPPNPGLTRHRAIRLES